MGKFDASYRAVLTLSALLIAACRGSGQTSPAPKATPINFASSDMVGLEKVFSQGGVYEDGATKMIVSRDGGVSTRELYIHGELYERTTTLPDGSSVTDNTFIFDRPHGRAVTTRGPAGMVTEETWDFDSDGLADKERRTTQRPGSDVLQIEDFEYDNSNGQHIEKSHVTRTQSVAMP